jgi:hypothetical protein
MTQTANPSLRELKRETEQTRAGLTQTVEQLRSSVTETASDIRHRLSPDAIKAEVADYVRSRGERLVDDITTAARRNPMQAVAVGASVAYPLFRLARAIPLPVLMVGAGMAVLAGFGVVRFLKSSSETDSEPRLPTPAAPSRPSTEGYRDDFTK